jgi:hypothetical protein
LIAVAIAIAVLTVAYWRHTRPYVWEQYEEPVDGAERDEPTQSIAAASGSGAPVTAAASAAPAEGEGEGRRNGAGGAGGADGVEGTSPAVTPSTGPVVPSLIPADVLAPTLSIVTLEDLERSGPTAGDDGSSGAANGDPGPATAPMTTVDGDAADDGTPPVGT